MKRSLLMLLCLVATACGNREYYDVPGPQGAKGDTGEVGAKGDTGNQGPEGVAGPQGAVGPQGAAGADGTNGVDGIPGTIVTMIKFCPGTPTYPSVFPEYGLKIGTSVYAVYSSHGGFLALLPPGEYHSAAVGSSCDFTVAADGTVTN